MLSFQKAAKAFGSLDRKLERRTLKRVQQRFPAAYEVTGMIATADLVARLASGDWNSLAP